MKPTDRVRVTGRFMRRSGEVGVVAETLHNWLVGVRFDGSMAVEFFVSAHLALVADDGPEEGTAA